MAVLHYYHFVFAESPDGREQTFTSCSIGLTEPCVTRQILARAKMVAGATQDSVMLNCSYLGEMTSEKFNEGY